MARITKLLYYVILLITFNACSPIGPITSAVGTVGNASISEKGLTKTVEDTYTKSKILAKISTIKIKNLTNVEVNVAFGKVLLTGYVNDQVNRLKVVNSVWNIDGVKEVFNEINIGNPPTFSQRTDDMIFQTKIQSRLLFKSGINSSNYHIDVVKGNVYVIGFADNLEEKTLVENFLKKMDDIGRLVTIISIPRQVKNE